MAIAVRFETKQHQLILNNPVSFDRLFSLGDSKKYYPPNPDVGEAILYKLMRMLHPRPFLMTRFGPQGSAAVVQAYNDHYYNIRFRYEYAVKPTTGSLE